MHVRTTKFLCVALAFLVFLWAGSVAAQERGASHGIVSEAASGPPSAYVEHFGVGLAPPVYLVNFLLLYFSNPENAAYMPAYRAELPQEVNECLQDPQTGLCGLPRRFLQGAYLLISIFTPPPNLFLGVFSETIGRGGDFFLSGKITYSDR